MVNAAKAKGSKAERDVVTYLASHGIFTERIPAGATADRGDLWLPGLNVPTIDVKDRRQLALAEWVDRAVEQAENACRPAGAVWHKRARKGSPADWYVTTSGAGFTALLRILTKGVA